MVETEFDSVQSGTDLYPILVRNVLLTAEETTWKKSSGAPE
jgi:hypothetical protein